MGGQQAVMLQKHSKAHWHLISRYSGFFGCSCLAWRGAPLGLQHVPARVGVRACIFLRLLLLCAASCTLLLQLRSGGSDLWMLNIRVLAWPSKSLGNLSVHPRDNSWSHGKRSYVMLRGALSRSPLAIARASARPAGSQWQRVAAAPGQVRQPLVCSHTPIANTSFTAMVCR